MSTSSCLTSNSIGGSSSASSTTSSVAASTPVGNVRKQILPLKPKQPNSYVQHLEIKGKDAPSVPVTMLELKKKEKLEKNVVTKLIYRKPSSFSSGTSDRHHLEHHSMIEQSDASSRRPGSPSSSGYETDSLVDQENCDVFSGLLGNTFAYGHHHELDMLHSHPIWSPMNNNSLLMANNNHHHHYGFGDDEYLVQ